MKKKLKVLLFVVLVVFLTPLVAYGGINAYALLSARSELYALEKAEEMPKGADAVLVLGAGVRSDGTPSDMLQDRLLCALALYERGICDKIIVSGDHGAKDYDEVNVMKNYLVARQVPSECIFMDHAGFSTYESLYRAKFVFGAEKLIIVTQKYHSYRALMIGRALKMDCQAVAAPILAGNYEGYAKQPWYSFRESLARCKDFLYCLALPKPTYLGEKIPLSDSGDVTNDSM